MRISWKTQDPVIFWVRSQASVSFRSRVQVKDSPRCGSRESVKSRSSYMCSFRFWLRDSVRVFRRNQLQGKRLLDQEVFLVS